MSELRHETVLGLDNIPLELPLARLGSRSLAAALDYLVVMALIALWTGAMLVLSMVDLFDAGEADTAKLTWGAAVWILGVFAIEWGYFIAWEVATGGRTLGKLALDLRVTRRTGARAGKGALVARNLVRSIDLLIGPVMMLLDPLARRLGDWLGGTLVVHETPSGVEVELGRVPEGWSPRRVAVVEELLARADELDPAHAINLSRRVLGWVERDAPELLADLPPDADPLFLLRRALEASP